MSKIKQTNYRHPPMTVPKSRSIKPLAALSKPLRLILAGIKSLCIILLLGWATLAIYYSNLPWGWARLALAVVFLIFRRLGSLVLAYAADGGGLCGIVSRRGGMVQ